MNIIGKRLQQRRLASLVSTTVRSMLSSSESFINGTSIGYVEQMYESWKLNPDNVHVSWNAYFTNLAKGVVPAFVQPPTLGMTLPPGARITAALPVGATAKDLEDHLKIYQLVTAYQLKGHEVGDFDPLSIDPLV